MGTKSFLQLQASDNPLPIGLFGESGSILSFENEAYIVHLDPVEVGRQAVDLLAAVVAGEQEEPACRQVAPQITRPI